MSPKPKTDVLNYIKKLRKYAEKHPELVIGTVGLLGGLLAFFWSNSRLLFWASLSFLPVIILISLLWREKEPPQKKWAWFFNVGENNQHGGSWQTCREYGFLSAGGGPKWRDYVQRLSVGDPVYAYVSKAGYVGFGKVSEEAIRIKDFSVGHENIPLLSPGILPEELREQLKAASDDSEYSDWVVRVKWYKQDLFKRGCVS